MSAYHQDIIRNLAAQNAQLRAQLEECRSSSTATGRRLDVQPQAGWEPMHGARSILNTPSAEASDDFGIFGDEDKLYQLHPDLRPDKCFSYLSCSLTQPVRDLIITEKSPWWENSTKHMPDKPSAPLLVPIRKQLASRDDWAQLEASRRAFERANTNQTFLGLPHLNMPHISPDSMVGAAGTIARAPLVWDRWPQRATFPISGHGHSASTTLPLERFPDGLKFAGRKEECKRRSNGHWYCSHRALPSRADPSKPCYHSCQRTRACTPAWKPLLLLW